MEHDRIKASLPTLDVKRYAEILQRHKDSQFGYTRTGHIEYWQDVKVLLECIEAWKEKWEELWKLMVREIQDRDKHLTKIAELETQVRRLSEQMIRDDTRWAAEAKAASERIARLEAELSGGKT